MVTMTSEADKTQTSLAIASKTTCAEVASDQQHQTQLICGSSAVLLTDSGATTTETDTDTDAITTNASNNTNVAIVSTTLDAKSNELTAEVKLLSEPSSAESAAAAKGEQLASGIDSKGGTSTSSTASPTNSATPTPTPTTANNVYSASNTSNSNSHNKQQTNECNSKTTITTTTPTFKSNNCSTSATAVATGSANAKLPPTASGCSNTSSAAAANNATSQNSLLPSAAATKATTNSSSNPPPNQPPAHAAANSNHANSQQQQQPSQSKKNEDAPNILVYKKMEAIIEKMQAESTGVSVRTVKSFMSKVPSVFTGSDLIAWILKNMHVDDVAEALHFAHLLAAHGYIFPIDDHCLTVKNDGTFYRFQTPYFWPSNCWEPENTDYAVYLCKRTMQNKTRLELADYEAENLAKLQKMFSRKWEFIFMQAESQSKVAKKRDKLERKVLDSQERAFWDVHRPMPGCVNTTEIDIKKAYRRGASSHGTGSGGASVAKNPVEQLTRIITLRKQKLDRRTIKVSKAAEALVGYYEQYNEFDYFITLPELPNPWQTDSTEMWDAERNSKDVPLRRVKRWAFSLRELLNDAVGREQFTKFLEKEYSGENLKFWESVQQMKTLPQSEIKEAIRKIWQEFLAPDAPCPVNVDSKSVELAREAVNATGGPNRWCFDVAAAHVYHLMKSDSYSRYLRSEMYKDYLNCSRKKIKSIPNLFGVKR